MAGRHFCVSFARHDNLKTCLQIGQSVMFDNGAFSAHTRGKPLDVAGYYAWIDKHLAHPHWAVVPDSIDGDLSEQHRLRSTWPRHTLPMEMAAAVWHLHEPLNELYALTIGWPRVCLGSSGEYWNVGSPKWSARMDQVFNFLSKRSPRMPYLHGLRMLGQTEGGWPLASADSTNVAQNFKRNGCAECLASGIDSRQPEAHWTLRPEQESLFMEYGR